jgi:hypothetical protein
MLKMPNKKAASQRRIWWLRLKHASHTTWRKVRAFYGRHRLLKVLSLILGVLLALVLVLAIIFRPQDHRIQRIGSSFSVKYAEELGINWQDAYLALLDDVKVKHLRLMSPWDRHEPFNNQYIWDELDWQMDEAAKRDVKVSLAVGLRQPRWPECHLPQWAWGEDREEWQPELMEYIEEVVERYKGHPALDSYQLENEALNQWFGECVISDRVVLKTYLSDEYELIKSIDPKHPIIMSLSDQHGIPVGEPTPDIYGYSVYRVVYNTQIAKGYFIYPTPVWYHRMRAFIIDVLKDRPILVHELQMEPWGPAPTPQLSIPEQDKSMSVPQMYKNVDFARQIGLDEAYMWGAEWWYWRKEALSDPAPWAAAKDMVRQINAGRDFTIPRE